MTLLPDEKNKTEKLKEPGRKSARKKVWRNRWRARRTFWDDGYHHRQTGDEYFGKGKWPSKKIAKQKADEWIVKLGKYAEYLGAFETE